MIDKIVRSLNKMVEKLRDHHAEQNALGTELHQQSVEAYSKATRAKHIADNIDTLLGKNPNG